MNAGIGPTKVTLQTDFSLPGLADSGLPDGDNEVSQDGAASPSSHLESKEFLPSWPFGRRNAYVSACTTHPHVALAVQICRDKLQGSCLSSMRYARYLGERFSRKCCTESSTSITEFVYGVPEMTLLTLLIHKRNQTTSWYLIGLYHSDSIRSRNQVGLVTISASRADK